MVALLSGETDRIRHLKPIGRTDLTSGEFYTCGPLRGCACDLVTRDSIFLKSWWRHNGAASRKMLLVRILCQLLVFLEVDESVVEQPRGLKSQHVRQCPAPYDGARLCTEATLEVAAKSTSLRCCITLPR